MLTRSPPCAYLYLDLFFYTTDKQGRLEVLGAFSLDVIPPEQWASRFQQVTEIALDMKIIPLQESNTSPNIEALWRSYQSSGNWA